MTEAAIWCCARCGREQQFIPNGQCKCGCWWVTPKSGTTNEMPDNQTTLPCPVCQGTGTRGTMRGDVMFVVDCIGCYGTGRLRPQSSSRLDIQMSDKQTTLEDDFGGYTAPEVAQLCDLLANAADRGQANSYQEIASISHRASAAIRYLIQISGYGTSAHD